MKKGFSHRILKISSFLFRSEKKKSVIEMYRVVRAIPKVNKLF